MTDANTLGLDFEQLKIQDTPEDTAADPSGDKNQPKTEKKKPYVNPERVKTGGSERVRLSLWYFSITRLTTRQEKLSDEALTERMARIKEQNEKIKQRRLVRNSISIVQTNRRYVQDVQADEDAFKKTQESERARIAQIRKVQDNVDRTREQNAQRKMAKIESREWDSGKPTGDNSTRGSVRGRGRGGRGRGRGGAPIPAPTSTSAANEEQNTNSTSTDASVTAATKTSATTNTPQESTSEP